MTSIPVVRAYTTAQIADYPSGAAFGPRRVPDFELIWLLRGSAVWSRQDLDADGRLGSQQQVQLQPGLLALARRGSLDHFSWDPDQPSRHAFIHFSVLDPGSLVQAQPWAAVRDLGELPVLAGLCGYLLDLSGLGPEAAWERTDHVIGLIVDIMIAGPGPNRVDQWPPTLIDMIDFVRLSWTQDGMRIIEVGELATAAHVSPGQVHRLMRARFAMGPRHALELIRLARAAISLQRSNAPLTAIARDTGFTNPYHFSRRFSAAYGCPPGAFRRQTELGDPLGPIRRARLSALAQRLL